MTPLLFKVTALVVDMVDDDGVDIIVGHKEEQALKLRDYLAAEHPDFPSELSQQLSPKELLEDDFGLEAFFLSSTEAEPPEYVVADDFPEVERLKELLRRYDKVFMPSAEPMDCEPMKVELVDDARMKRQPL